MNTIFNPKEHTITCIYNNTTLHFKDVEECTKDLFQFEIKKEKNKFGEYSWILYENNKKQGRSWATIEEHGNNGYTYEECVRDYLYNFLSQHTYKNLHFFKLLK